MRGSASPHGRLGVCVEVPADPRFPRRRINESAEGGIRFSSTRFRVGRRAVGRFENGGRPDNWHVVVFDRFRQRRPQIRAHDRDQHIALRPARGSPPTVGARWLASPPSCLSPRRPRLGTGAMRTRRRCAHPDRGTRWCPRRWTRDSRDPPRASPRSRARAPAPRGAAAAAPRARRAVSAASPSSPPPRSPSRRPPAKTQTPSLPPPIRAPACAPRACVRA
jgi:hypothetical protein